MRIESFGQNRVAPLRQATTTKPVNQPAEITRPSAGEPVQLSQNAHLFQAIAQVLNQMPEVREDLVATVKEKLQNGQYDVASDDLARLLLEAIENSRGNYSVAA